MDWSSNSAVANSIRDPHKVYEEEFVSSWEIDHAKDSLYPTNIE